ncbi:MAG: O-antigen ligase [Shinella sp.]|nr:MAG: O-antigen ligase [Shinella sp.]
MTQKTAIDKLRNWTWSPYLLMLLWVGMISAPIVESDTYRYTALALVAIGYLFFRQNYRLLKSDYFAYLCIAWGLYAFFRFAYGVFVLDEKGTSEWLYVFPIFFPGLGIALYSSRQYVFPAISLFMAIALAALLVSTDYSGVLAGERTFPLYHNNPIHSAIGCGLIVIGAFYWMLEAGETGRLVGWKKHAILATGCLIIALGLFNIYGAKSKGVWLALIFTIIVVAATSFLHQHRRYLVPIVVGAFALLAVGLYNVQDNIAEFAGPTYDAAVNLSENALEAPSIEGAMRSAIEAPETPDSMRERLELWSNALELISMAPLFGHGNDWLRLWRQTTYGGTRYVLLHNGYLEILVRHGLFGLTLLGVSIVISWRRLSEAYRRKAISHSTLMCASVLTVFFMVTLFSNSNNRLALGESFFMVMAAAVFAISFLSKTSAEAAGSR